MPDYWWQAELTRTKITAARLGIDISGFDFADSEDGAAVYFTDGDAKHYVCYGPLDERGTQVASYINGLQDGMEFLRKSVRDRISEFSQGFGLWV